MAILVSWWPYIAEFLGKHREGLALFGMALIVTMRPRLPWPFHLVDSFEWAYEWLREALLTLLSMRGPMAHTQTAEIVKEDAKGNVSTAKMTAASTEPETPEKEKAI